MNVHVDILPSIVFGLFVFVALISGLFMIKAETRQAGVAENHIADLCFWLMIAAIVGGRCGALLYRPETVFSDPVEVLRIWNGGSFYYGGATAALAGGAVFIKHTRLPLWKTADLFAPALAIGHFFVWIGCFFSGLCSIWPGGGMLEALLLLSEESMKGLTAFPNPRALYLACGSFIVFVTLLLLRGHRNFDGRGFWVLTTLLSLLQLAVDTIDMPGYPQSSGSMASNSLIINILVVIAGLTTLLILWRRSRERHSEEAAGAMH
jgi:phosphatidylglycerol:prolipoprotein diacylglycerol transferase